MNSVLDITIHRWKCGDRGRVFRFAAAAGIGWFKSQCTSPLLLQTCSQLPGITHSLSSFLFGNFSFMKESYSFCILNWLQKYDTQETETLKRVCLIVITFAIYMTCICGRFGWLALTQTTNQIYFKLKTHI